MGIEYIEITKKLIQTTLVLPIGSADAERGFSIMNNIKDGRRNRLNPKTLEELMRIRINTEDDLSIFPAKRYAKQWVKENHLRSDDNRFIHKKNQKSFEKKTFAKIIIFMMCFKSQ